MIIDENMALVKKSIEEIKKIEFINDMPLKQEIENDIIVIDNFDKAINMAFDFDEYEVEGEAEYSWTDIKELEMSKVYENVYEIEDYKDIMIQVRNITFDIDTIKLQAQYHEIIEEIYADLINCIRTRSILGNKDNLFEMIFKVYKAGGWPCGWEGNYPTGKVIAYFNK